MIRMSLIKKLENLTENNFMNTFLFCLIIYVLINLIVTLIGYAVDGLINYLLANFYVIIYGLFAPTATPPSFAIIIPLAIPTMGSLTAGIVIMSIGYMISPLITALIAGRNGESKYISFGAWFLLSLLSSIISLFFYFSPMPPYSPMLIFFLLVQFATGAKPSDINTMFLFFTILGGIINGMFYGSIAMLANKS